MRPSVARVRLGIKFRRSPDRCAEMRKTLACVTLLALLPLALAEEPRQDPAPAVGGQVDEGVRYFASPKLSLELEWNAERLAEAERNQKDAEAWERAKARWAGYGSAAVGVTAIWAGSIPWVNKIPKVSEVLGTGAVALGQYSTRLESNAARIGQRASEDFLQDNWVRPRTSGDYSLKLSYGRGAFAADAPGADSPFAFGLDYGRLAGELTGDALGMAVERAEARVRDAEREVERSRLEGDREQLRQATDAFEDAKQEMRGVAEEVRESQKRAERHALTTAEYAKKMFLAVEELQNATAKESLAGSRRRFGRYDHVARSLAALEQAAVGGSKDLETLDEVAAVLADADAKVPKDLQKKHEKVVGAVQQFDQYARATFELTNETLDALSGLGVLSEEDVKPIREAVAVGQQLQSAGMAVLAGISPDAVQPLGYMQAATAALSLFGLGAKQTPADARVMAYLEGMRDEMRANHAETMERLTELGVNMDAGFQSVERRIGEVRQNLRDMDDRMEDIHFAQMTRFDHLEEIGRENNKLLRDLTDDVAEIGTSVFIGRVGLDFNRQVKLIPAYDLLVFMRKERTGPRPEESHYDFMTRVFAKNRGELFRRDDLISVTERAFRSGLPESLNGPRKVGPLFWGSAEFARDIPGADGAGDPATLAKLDAVARKMYVHPYRYLYSLDPEPSLLLDLSGGDARTGNLPPRGQRDHAEFLMANAGLLVSADRVLIATECALTVLPFMQLVDSINDPKPDRLLTFDELTDTASQRQRYEARAERQRELLLRCRSVLDVAIVQLSILHGADLAPRMAADVPVLLKLDAARRNAARQDLLASEIARLQPNLTRLSARLDRHEDAAKRVKEAAAKASEILAEAEKRRRDYSERRELDPKDGKPRFNRQQSDREDRGWARLDAVVKRWAGRAATLESEERETGYRADRLRQVVDRGTQEIEEMRREREALEAEVPQKVAVPARVDHIEPALENNPWVRENFIRALIHARLTREGSYWGRLARYQAVLGRHDASRLKELLGDDLPFKRQLPDDAAEGEPESWHLVLDGQSIPLPPAEDVEAGATVPPPLLPELLDARRRVDAALDDVNFPLRQAEIAGVAQR